jgi:hypothetical protein
VTQQRENPGVPSAPAAALDTGSAGRAEAAAPSAGAETVRHGAAAGTPPPAEAAADEAPPIPVARIADLFSALDKSVRARRLYQQNNPVYLGFIRTLESAFTTLWDDLPMLSAVVEEHAFRWYGHRFTVGEGRDTLPFLFYKDGVRHLTFLPGFEEEIARFLDVIDRVRALGQQADEDMVTLLWQEEFESFQYSYVDALAEGVNVPDSVDLSTLVAVQLPPGAVAGDVDRGDPAEQSPIVQQGGPTVASAIFREDFDETTYFLDVEELELLRIELEKEARRDVKTDVLNALFDRLEDPMPDRQLEVLRILRQLLPAFLARGDLGSASLLLTELNAALELPLLQEREREEAAGIFRELSDPAVLGQFFHALAEGALDPSSSEIGVFLAHLGPGALPLLVQAVEDAESAAMKDRLTGAIQTLAMKHPSEMKALLAAPTPAIAAGAARLAGRLGRPELAGPVAGLLEHDAAHVRLAATEALTRIASSVAMEGLKRALSDDDREVRVAAARGLAALRYAPARGWFEEVIQSREIRDADLTEKMAFFEAYGVIAKGSGIELLDRLLNGRRLFSRESPEVRACAAMALGRVGTPAARDALRRAGEEQNPIVRNAVTRALREAQNE